MVLQIDERESYKHVKVQEKRLDILSSPLLITELVLLIQINGNKNIILDTSSCSYCDASGLKAIQVIHLMCNKAGGLLILTGIQANIEKLIKICMLDLEWNIAKDQSEVETLLKRSA